MRGHGRVPWELYLRDPGGASASAGRDEWSTVPPSVAIRVEWTGDAVRWGVAADVRETPLHATAGLLHEPCGELYAALPLARYDRRARRFWNAVLWIARWPGASRLFGWLARRHRSNDTG
jgi:hypothetical protein